MKRLLRRGGSALGQSDWWLVGAVFFLVFIGLAIQYSIDLNDGDVGLSQFYKHLTFVVVGLASFFLFSTIDRTVVKLHPAILFAVALLLLAGVLLFGSVIQGTRGWFVVGSLSVQPVEFVKLLLIIFMASFFSVDAARAQQLRYLLVTGAATGLILLLVLLQPDLGSSLVLFFIWYGYVLVLRAPKWFSAGVLGAAVLAGIVGWFFLFADYQKERLATFIHPGTDPLGAGYNITQSIVAVGSGEFWGRGLGLGTQSQLHFLPEVASDFIFAVVAEELGFIGALALLIAIGLLLYRLWRGMRQARDTYSFLLLLGVTVYLAGQSFMVIGMNIGVLPVTGVPLPLVSAGGTSLVMTLIVLGIAHSCLISRR